MDVRVVAVHPGTQTMVDAVVAGARVRAEWVGVQPFAGALVDVELGTDEVLQ